MPSQNDLPTCQAIDSDQDCRYSTRWLLRQRTEWNDIRGYWVCPSSPVDRRHVSLLDVSTEWVGNRSSHESFGSCQRSLHASYSSIYSHCGYCISTVLNSPSDIDRSAPLTVWMQIMFTSTTSDKYSASFLFRVDAFLRQIKEALGRHS